MAARFNRLVRAGHDDARNWTLADNAVMSRSGSDRMIFMSHKTGDRKAEEEARYIARRHGVQVYMAEWDDSVQAASSDLPEYIMKAIRNSDGFLVNVVAQIVESMWIGYEIGGAPAMEKSRAKIMYNLVPRLPSVVNTLNTLRSRSDLDRWISEIVR